MSRIPLPGLIGIRSKATLRVDDSLDNDVPVALTGGTISGPGQLTQRNVKLEAVSGRLGVSGAGLKLLIAPGEVEIGGSIPLNGSLLNDGVVDFLAGASLTLEDNSLVDNGTS